MYPAAAKYRYTYNECLGRAGIERAGGLRAPIYRGAQYKSHTQRANSGRCLTSTAAVDSSRGRRAAAAAAECRRCSQVRAAARHSQLCKSLARDDRHAAARRTADCQRHERDEHRGLSRQQGRERTCVPVVVVRRTAPERALPSIVRQPRAAAAHRNVDLELRCLQGPDGAGDERQPGGGGRLQAGGQQSAD